MCAKFRGNSHDFLFSNENAQSHKTMLFNNEKGKAIVKKKHFIS